MPRWMISLFFNVMTGVAISICVRARPHSNQFLKYTVVFGRQSDIPNCLPQRRRCKSRQRQSLPPSSLRLKENGIAKGHVSHRNRAAVRPWRIQFIFGNGKCFGRKSGAANRAKVIELYDEPLAHAVEIRNVFERTPLALLLCAVRTRREEAQDGSRRGVPAR